MISLRGGLGALGTNKVLRLLVSFVLPKTESQLFQSGNETQSITTDEYVDVTGGLNSSFETVLTDSEATTIPSNWSITSLGTISSDMLSTHPYAPGTGFTEISTVCDLDANHLQLLDAVASLVVTTESFFLLTNSSPLDLSYLRSLWESVVKRLLDWAIPSDVNPNVALKHDYQRICRRSALVYAGLVIGKFRFPDKLLLDIRSDPLQSLQRVLNRGLSHSRLPEIRMRPLTELLLWCFFLDGMKARLKQEMGTPWLAPGIRGLCGVLIVQTWPEVRKVLELFLWSRPKLDEDGERFWKEVMATQD